MIENLVATISKTADASVCKPTFGVDQPQQVSWNAWRASITSTEDVDGIILEHQRLTSEWRG